MRIPTLPCPGKKRIRPRVRVTLRTATREIGHGSNGMAMKIPAPALQPWCVDVNLPNETETQILGGNDAHSAAGYNLGQTLRTYSEREGKVWLVRFESELRYPRTGGKTGVFFPDVLMVPDVRL